jgi:hypothetical protein
MNTCKKPCYFKEVLAVLIVFMVLGLIGWMILGSTQVVLPVKDATTGMVDTGLTARMQMIAGLKQYFQGLGAALLLAAVAFCIIDRPTEQEEVLTAPTPPVK